jgi:quinol monooxygenase YgiN
MIRVVLEHKTRDENSTDRLVAVIRRVRDEARKQRGFIMGHTLVDVDDPCHVVVISSWQKEEDWKTWDSSYIRMFMLGDIEEELSEPYTEVTIKDSVIWKEEIAHVF